MWTIWGNGLFGLPRLSGPPRNISNGTDDIKKSSPNVKAQLFEVEILYLTLNNNKIIIIIYFNNNFKQDTEL
jgi:hypothetical protein